MQYGTKGDEEVVESGGDQRDRLGKHQRIPWCPPPWTATKSVVCTLLVCVGSQDGKQEEKSDPTGAPADGGEQLQITG